MTITKTVSATKMIARERNGINGKKKTMPTQVVPEPEEWNQDRQNDKRQLIQDLKTLLKKQADGKPSPTALMLEGSLIEICDPIIASNAMVRETWMPYQTGQKHFAAYIEEWLEYSPDPNNPERFVLPWDYLANTACGLKLVYENEDFKSWFVRFLRLRARFLNSTRSAKLMNLWVDFKGTPDHPCNMDAFEIPREGFRSHNEFFLRLFKPHSRPLCEEEKNDPHVAVSPCDAGVFFLTMGNKHNNNKERGVLEDDALYTLPRKSNDKFNVKEGLEEYGSSFVDGPILDFLLGFHDYHHFHAPVTGKVVCFGEYRGSYNYHFLQQDAPQDSARAGWYNQPLAKHKRTVWIIQTERLGLVAMVAIGFWTVGSIVPIVREKGAFVEKGDCMGRFEHGGSSILLAFEPSKKMDFTIGDNPIQEDADHPTMCRVKQRIGKLLSAEPVV